MADPTVAAGIVRGMFEAAVRSGAERAALSVASGIAAADLDDQDKRIPLARYHALIRAGQRLARDPALALHYGESVDLADVSVVGLIGRASETMAQAFLQLQRYSKLLVDIDGGAGSRFGLEWRGSELWLVDNRLNPNQFFEHTEIAFAQMVSNCRRLGVDPFTHEVRVTHNDPGYRGEYERILGAPVTFGSTENAMRLEHRFLFHPLARQPEYVFGVLSDRAETLLKGLQDLETLRGMVEAAILPILHTGDAKIDVIAKRLGMSRQTLYRRLRAEGVTFETVLDEIRRKLADHYLGGRKVSVNQTAYLLGFSQSAAFSRAFKRWTGSSPIAAKPAKNALGNQKDS